MGDLSNSCHFNTFDFFRPFANGPESILQQ